MGFPRLNLPSVSERLGNVTDRLRGIMPQGLSGRIGFPHGLSAAGGLTLPYKVAVVAVMVLVAGGTLVTFGSAGAETAKVGGSTSEGSALPGTSEIAPRVEGQVVSGSYSPGTSILSADDLLASLKLTDYSPKSDDDKSDDDKSDDDKKKSDDKKSNDNKNSATPAGTPSSTPSASGGTSGSSSNGSNNQPSNQPSSEPTKAPEPAPTTAPKPEPKPEPVCKWVMVKTGTNALGIPEYHSEKQCS